MEEANAIKYCAGDASCCVEARTHCTCDVNIDCMLLDRSLFLRSISVEFFMLRGCVGILVACVEKWVAFRHLFVNLMAFEDVDVLKWIHVVWMMDESLRANIRSRDVVLYRLKLSVWYKPAIK